MTGIMKPNGGLFMGSNKIKTVYEYLVRVNVTPTELIIYEYLANNNHKNDDYTIHSLKNAYIDHKNYNSIDAFLYDYFDNLEAQGLEFSKMALAEIYKFGVEL